MSAETLAVVADVLDRQPMDFYSPEPPPPPQGLPPALVIFRGDPTDEDLKDEKILNERIAARRKKKTPPKW
jgi:hypothetical protein